MILRNLILLLVFPYSIAWSQNLDSKVDSIIATMNVNQKINQLINNGFFSTANDDSLNIPGFLVSDGPHGFQQSTATAFPTTMAMIATWDKKIWKEVGIAMGEEFSGFGRNVQLGPCLDLCRNPRSGRASEMVGEDPYLGSIYAEEIIKGIQTNQVIATAKHFIGTNKENNRSTANVLIDKNNLMNYNGLTFKRAIQEGGALSIMNSYNYLNSIHVSENKYLLDTLLRQKWGFPFFIMSDWGSIKNAQKALQAGTDICMGSKKYENELFELLKTNKISENDLNVAVKKVLKTKLLYGNILDNPIDNSNKINSKTHQSLALETAQKAIILLKNEDQILPLQKAKKIALIGPSVLTAKTDAFGSARVTPPYTVSPKRGIENKIQDSLIGYTIGCPIKDFDTSDFKNARLLASKADYVIFFGGLDETMEGEGFGTGGDRKNNSLDLPLQQQLLIKELAKVNKQLIVVLQSGGICALSNSCQSIKGLIYTSYLGMESGNAIADVLFGDYNPSAKLPVTMPYDNSQHPNWDDNFNNDYHLNYCYFDELNIQPQFAFGYGLSYSKFEISGLTIKDKNIELGKEIDIQVNVTNNSTIEGEEVVQLYITKSRNLSWNPKKELKGFEKVNLKANEKKKIEFKITNQELYTIVNEEYKVIPGTYYIGIGNSSDNITLRDSFVIINTTPLPDLRVLSIYTIPRFPKKNDEVTFFATIRNDGNAPTTKDNHHIVSFSVNNKQVGWSKPINKVIHEGQMIFVESEKFILDTSNWIVSDTGIIKITAFTDFDNTISEIHEFNNEKDLFIYITKTKNNIAINKPVKVSSTENNNFNTKSIVDGKENTRWSSSFLDDQWVIINLQDCYKIDEIQLLWEKAYAKKFYIAHSLFPNQFKDTLYTTNNGQGGKNIIRGNPFIAQFIKLGLKERVTDYGFSLHEMKIFGELSNECFEKKLNNTRFHFFPNPTNNFIYFNFSNEDVCSEIKVYDHTGKLLKSLNGTSKFIDITDFNGGVYYLSFDINGEIINERCVKL